MQSRVASFLPTALLLFVLPVLLGPAFAPTAAAHVLDGGMAARTIGRPAPGQLYLNSILMHRHSPVVRINVTTALGLASNSTTTVAPITTPTAMPIPEVIAVTNTPKVNIASSELAWLAVFTVMLVMFVAMVGLVKAAIKNNDTPFVRRISPRKAGTPAKKDRLYRRANRKQILARRKNAFPSARPDYCMAWDFLAVCLAIACITVILTTAWVVVYMAAEMALTHAGAALTTPHLALPAPAVPLALPAPQVLLALPAPEVPLMLAAPVAIAVAQAIPTPAPVTLMLRGPKVLLALPAPTKLLMLAPPPAVLITVPVAISNATVPFALGPVLPAATIEFISTNIEPVVTPEKSVQALLSLLLEWAPVAFQLFACGALVVVSFYGTISLLAIVFLCVITSIQYVLKMRSAAAEKSWKLARGAPMFWNMLWKEKQGACAGFAQLNNGGLKLQAPAKRKASIGSSIGSSASDGSTSSATASPSTTPQEHVHDDRDRSKSATTRRQSTTAEEGEMTVSASAAGELQQVKQGGQGLFKGSLKIGCRGSRTSSDSSSTSSSTTVGRRFTLFKRNSSASTAALDFSGPSPSPSPSQGGAGGPSRPPKRGLLQTLKASLTPKRRASISTSNGSTRRSSAGSLGAYLWGSGDGQPLVELIVVDERLMGRRRGSSLSLGLPSWMRKRSATGGVVAGR